MKRLYCELTLSFESGEHEYGAFADLEQGLVEPSADIELSGDVVDAKITINGLDYKVEPIKKDSSLVFQIEKQDFELLKSSNAKPIIRY